MEEKRKLKLSEVITAIDSGLTRKQIKKEFDLTVEDMRTIFAHPELKNRKPKVRNVIFVDDSITEEIDSKSESENIDELFNTDDEIQKLDKEPKIEKQTETTEKEEEDILPF